eukprot:9977295-Lingulodinium_polyedra.AAC.1
MEEEYPAHILRITVQAFRWRRFLCMDGIMHEGVLPHRGITAGCFSATFALRCYLVRLARRQVASHPAVSILIHIDDFEMEVEADAARVAAKAMGKAAAGLKEGLEAELDFGIS